MYAQCLRTSTYKQTNGNTTCKRTGLTGKVSKPVHQLAPTFHSWSPYLCVHLLECELLFSPDASAIGAHRCAIKQRAGGDELQCGCEAHTHGRAGLRVPVIEHLETVRGSLAYHGVATACHLSKRARHALRVLKYPGSANCVYLHGVGVLLQLFAEPISRLLLLPRRTLSAADSLRCGITHRWWQKRGP